MTNLYQELQNSRLDDFNAIICPKIMPKFDCPKYFRKLSEHFRKFSELMPEFDCPEYSKRCRYLRNNAMTVIVLLFSTQDKAEVACV